jgi:hypothetical protein
LHNLRLDATVLAGGGLELHHPPAESMTGAVGAERETRFDNGGKGL